MLPLNASLDAMVLLLQDRERVRGAKISPWTRGAMSNRAELTLRHGSYLAFGLQHTLKVIPVTNFGQGRALAKSHFAAGSLITKNGAATTLAAMMRGARAKVASLIV